MDKINLSEQAYNEFRDFLKENEVEQMNIRINLAGFGCSGPSFNITVSEATDVDYVQTVNEITFMAEQKLIEEFGGFNLLSSEENEGRGLSLKPVLEAESGGCGSCGGGCH